MQEHHTKASVQDPTQMLLKNSYNQTASDAMVQFATSMTNWSQELLAFSARRVSEYAKLMERLMQCQSAPEIMKAEWEYLESLRQQCTNELPRLFTLNEEFLKQNVLPPVSSSSSGQPSYSESTRRRSGAAG